MRTFDWSVRFGTRFLDFVQDGQCYTISPLSSLSSLLVMFYSREIVHARRIATYPGCKINLNIPVVSRVRVTLVKITKPDSHTSHAGEKSSLVGYKRTPCSTPLLPLSPLFCLFSCAASWFGYDVAKSITASLLIGCLDTKCIARETNFFPFVVLLFHQYQT